MAEAEQKTGIDISISIVNWHTRDDLLACLASIVPEQDRARAAGEAFEVDAVKCQLTVVDNASFDGSVEAVVRDFPVARMLPQSQNFGFAKGQNLAMAHGSGRYFLLLNPDTLVAPGALGALALFADTHPQGAIFGPKILNPDGSIQFSARSFPTLMAGIFRNSFLGRLFPKNRYTRQYLQEDWDHNDARTVDWVSGAAMLIRREAAEHLEGLDESYYMYVEDVDICWRARQKGWEVWYCPDAVVEHKKARASDLAPNRMIYHHHRSMYTFFKKHYRANASLFERLVTLPGLCVRAAYFIARNKAHKWLHGRR